MNNRFDRLFAFNAYEEAEDSDNEGADSSDDDVDAMLQGTMEQVKRIRHRRGCQESSSEDEFEKEMKNELEETMKNIENNRSAAVSDDTLAVSSGQKLTSFYDNSYFDSDSDENETSEEKKKIKRPIPSNDELFYDPEMDDHDQKWIDQQRRAYQPKPTSVVAKQQQGQTPGKPRPLPLSDAVLNCPGCMSLLCLDCQRHATYSHQYRAMFVMNCTPDMTEVLHHTMLTKKKKSNKRKRPQTEGQGDNCTSSSANDLTDDDVEVYHPVRCDLCKTEVAVYDKDEVFHFFNILSSY